MTATSSTSNLPAKRNPLIVGSYATIILLWAVSQFILVPYVIHLLVLVTAILYAACHMALGLREDVPLEGEEGYDPDNIAAPKETMRKEDAMQFPIMGSISLFSLYLAFKFLGKDWVNLLIGGYFGMVGCGALTMTISPLLTLLAPKWVNAKKLGWEYELNHPLPSWIIPTPLDLGVQLTLTDLLAFIKSAIIVAFYFHGKHWPLNNVLGICFCLQGIERFSLGTYKIGAILLVGLFFYDIFWVFGTDVMVTVAKNLDGPIKILFPRSLVPNDDGKINLSLLGLGDIVIPGFFLSLLLRFDAHIAKMPTKKVDIHAPFAKPYFHSALLAYVLGLCTTLFVMIQFKAAQPALLYLVPACLGSSFLCATLRGEVKELLAYTEEEEEKEEVKPAEAKKDD
jgi:minor histocompatibility antigen H13